MCHVGWLPAIWMTASKNSMLAYLSKIFRRLGEVVCPRHCRLCRRRLAPTERSLCSACSLSLPYTRYRAAAGNPLELLLHGRFPFEKASAYLYYIRGTRSRHIIFDLKYYNHPEVGLELGRRMAADVLDTGFFEGIEVLIPVPLARRRQKKRGYNQSEWLARGISGVTGLPVEAHALERTVDNPSQTTRTIAERAQNVEGIFALTPKGAALLRGHHVLLVDDVVTTGATVTACADALLQAENVKISVLSLSLSDRINCV